MLLQVDHIKPLFPAVYDADVEISLEGEEGEQELLGVLKQAAFQLSSTDVADKALATALATLAIAEDPATVVVDASGISEALEEPFNVCLCTLRCSLLALPDNMCRYNLPRIARRVSALQPYLFTPITMSKQASLHETQACALYCQSTHVPKAICMARRRWLATGGRLGENWARLETRWPALLHSLLLLKSSCARWRCSSQALCTALQPLFRYSFLAS